MVADRRAALCRRVLTFLLAAALLCTAVAPASAGDEDVPILVQVILASNAGEGFDPPSVERVVKLLGSPYDMYSSYRLVTEQHLVLPPQQPGIVALPGNRTLVVTPLTGHAQIVQIQAAIEGYIQSKLVLRQGTTQFIGGISEPEGDLLIAITLK